MPNFLPTPGSNDLYTALLDAGILAGGVESTWSNPLSGAVPVTIDPTINNGVTNWKFTFSGTGSLTVTLGAFSTTLFPAQKLKIVVLTGAYAVTLTMPSNFYYQRGAPPAMAQSARNWIEFQFDDVLGNWYETSRGADATTTLVGGWNSLTLGSGWAPLAGWQVPQYQLDTLGYVNLRGVATTAAGVAANTTLFTIPTGMLPPANEVASVSFFNGTVMTAGELDLLTTGNAQVLQAIPAGGYVPLNSIRYSVDA